MSVPAMALCVSGASLKKARHSFWLTVEGNLPNLFQSLPLLPALAFAAVFLPAPLTLHAQAPAPSGTVISIAGNGLLGFSGDGGPATNASCYDIEGMAVGPDGTLYLSDSSNYRIRAVAPSTGFITTIAGTGASGADGNDGPATNATFGGVLGLAVDRARNVLYAADFDNSWVRAVNLTNGLLTAFAGVGPNGTGSFAEGPATQTEVLSPASVAVDGAGNVVIADDSEMLVSQVNPVNGVLIYLAGILFHSSYSGDGGPARIASFASAYWLGADRAGNVFVGDVGSGPLPQGGTRIRRIDAVTRIINTVAGGGTNAPADGPATNALLYTFGMATSDSGVIFVATHNQIFQVREGQMTLYAGNGTNGFSGDGGPAVQAEFGGITSLAVAPGGGLLIADYYNGRVRYVVPDSVVLTNDSGQTSFYLPWVSALSGDSIVANNTNLTVISLGSLTTVTGSVTISGNTSATVINLGSLTTASGNVTVSDNASVGVISLGSLTTASGSITVSSNASATVISLGSLTTASGSVTVSSNASATVINLGSLTTASGSVNVSDNASAGVISLGSLTTASGSVTVSSNASATVISLGSLTTASGSVNVSGNTIVTNIALGSLTNAGGNVTLTSNGPNAQVVMNGNVSIGGGTNAATLAVDGTIVLTNSTALIVTSNLTLSGNATVDGNVTNHGTISPGCPVGTIDINGALVLGASSTLSLELDGYAPGTGYDFIGVSGSVTLGGNLSVSLLSNFLPLMTNGASFTLLTSGSPLTGAFANVADGGTLTTKDGYARFTVHYAGQNNVRLTDMAILDTDHDGMPDWWEDQFGLNKNDPADAALDSDGDGASNLTEFLAGTDPKNAASVFHVVGVQPESGGVRLTWSTVGGKSYVVQTNGALTAAFSDFSLLIVMPGTGESTTNFFDGGASTNTSARFYRVRLGP